MRIQLLILAAMLVLPRVAAADVVAQCASPAGLAEYFRGELVSPAAARPEDAPTLSLVKQDGDYDLQLRRDGDTRSARALGGEITVSVQGGGEIHHAMVEQDGYRDHFLFATPKEGKGKVVWATQRLRSDHTTAMAAAPCR